jgi:hypothetical protein
VHLTCDQVTGSGSTRRRGGLKDEIALVFISEQHAREPGGVERVRIDLYCQYYGKSLSVEHWEETCDYYVRHFSFESYGRNGAIAKVGPSTPNPILCGLCMNGVTRSLRTRSRFDLWRLAASRHLP